MKSSFGLLRLLAIAIVLAAASSSKSRLDRVVRVIPGGANPYAHITPDNLKLRDNKEKNHAQV